MIDSVFNERGMLLKPIIYDGLQCIILDQIEDLEKADCVFGGEAEALTAQKYNLNKFFSFKKHVFKKRLSLFYGFNREACRISYRYNTDDIKLLKVKPKSQCEDFPYKDFPKYFSQIGYRISEKFECSRDKFSMAFFGAFEERLFSDVLFILPPITDNNISMWGESGDANWVLLFTYINLNKMEITSNSELM